MQKTLPPSYGAPPHSQPGNLCLCSRLPPSRGIDLDEHSYDEKNEVMNRDRPGILLASTFIVVLLLYVLHRTFIYFIRSFLAPRKMVCIFFIIIFSVRVARWHGAWGGGIAVDEAPPMRPRREHLSQFRLAKLEELRRRSADVLNVEEFVLRDPRGAKDLSATKMTIRILWSGSAEGGRVCWQWLCMARGGMQGVR